MTRVLPLKADGMVLAHSVCQWPPGLVDSVAPSALTKGKEWFLRTFMETVTLSMAPTELGLQCYLLGILQAASRPSPAHRQTA